MRDTLGRRKFLCGAAAAAAGTVAMSGEAAARYIGQPIFTTDYIYIREGPGIDYNYIRTCDGYTGLEIKNGPVDADGWMWWKYYVNGDAEEYGIVHDLDGMAGVSEPRPAIFLLDTDRTIEYAWVASEWPDFPDYDEIEDAIERLA